MSEPNEKPMNSDDKLTAGPQAWELSPELKPFEAQLSALDPRDDRLNRERLMFLAGQAIAGTKDEQPKFLRMNLERRAWPAAFAAMTAVAATLLVMVITKPESAVLRPLPGGEAARNDVAQIWADRDDGRTILSTMDAHLGDVEELLAKGEFLNAAADAASTPNESRGARLLTPGRWHEVLNESESVGGSSDGASNDPLIRGVTS